MVQNLPRDTIRLNIGPLLFNIFINKIFFFADDSTIYACGKDLPKIKEDFICTMKKICFLPGFSFTNIHDSQDSMGRRRVSI